jgi:PAS domain S-box-containing protein
MNKLPVYQQPEFQQELLKAISRNTEEFLAVVTEKTKRIVYLNEKGARLFGYKSARSLYNKVAPFKRKKKVTNALRKTIYDTITKEGVYSDEVEYLTNTGKSFWGKLQVNRFKVDETPYLLVQIEKTDRARNAEIKLTKEKDRFGALLDYASIAVIILNRQMKIMQMNPYALHLFGYTTAEISGKKLEVLLPKSMHKRHNLLHHQYFAKPANRPMAVGKDVTAVKKDGTTFPVEVNLGTYQTEDEVFVIAYVNDISVRKKAEEKILQLNAELENKIRQRTDELAESIVQLEHQIKQTEAAKEELKKSLAKEKELNLLKSRFVSTASHEFRTPLSTILSSTYLLQKYVNTEDQPKRDKHIERIVSSVNMLTDILNDFLSVGKIEEGKITTKFALFNICAHAEEVIESIKGMLKAGQEITCEMKGNKEVYLDPSMVKHIIMNLLSNAIKFSPENTPIKIVIDRKKNNLTLRVIDQGMGISNQDRQHLFERFFRGSNAGNIQGTGLGLHIVKKYAELMNGDVQCISELEKGTTFIVKFKLNNKPESIT